jgi:hypothetical protein
MRELVPLTNAVAALMIVSAMSGFGGDDVIVPGAPASVPTAEDAAAVAAPAQAKAATELAAVTAQVAPVAPAAPAAKRAGEAKAASPANDCSREHHSARWLLAVV